MSREEIIFRIKQGDQKVLKEIYENHREHFVKWFVNKYKCSTEEATELYQSVIVVFYESIVSGKTVEISHGLFTFLMGIGKNIFRSSQRKESKRAQVEGFYMVDEDPLVDILFEDHADYVLQKSKRDQVLGLVRSLGFECQKILEFYYYHKMSMKNISEKLGLESEKAAKGRKFRCMQELRDLYKIELKKTGNGK